jgi:hypothetical protein
MAAAEISDLTELTLAVDGDLLCLVDVSDTTAAASGTTKKITATNLRSYIAVESTFTPAITFGGGATGLTYAANGQVGEYSKIGNRVFFNLTVILTAVGSSTGTLNVTSLPFTSDAASNNNQAVTVRPQGLQSVTGGIAALILPNTTAILVYQTGTGTATALTHANCTASAQLNIAGHYTV